MRTYLLPALLTIGLLFAGEEPNPAPRAPALAPGPKSLQYKRLPWDLYKKTATADPKGQALLKRMTDEARAIMAKGIQIRPTRLDQLDKSDMPPSSYKTTGPKLEMFALAKKDNSQCGILFGQFAGVLTVAKLTGDAATMKYVIDQLREVATWSPFQRPGWTLSSSTGDLPPEGDGVWLATGWGLLAVVFALDALGPDLPPDLKTALENLVRTEAARVVESWEKKIPWYVKSQKVESNQWTFPLAGLLTASLYLGDSHRAAYDLAVAGLSRTLAAQGEDGSWVEGYSYGAITAGVLFQSLATMARSGDGRLMAMPFAQHFSDWLLQQNQPGGTLINCFDSGSYLVPPTAPPAMAYNLLGTSSPQATWAFNHLHAQWPATWVSLDLMARNLVEKEPPPFQHFPVPQLLVWRSGWDLAHSHGFWVRGGGALDFHCHRDQGHFSVLAGDRAIMVELGMNGYGPDHPMRASEKGHSVLQVGDPRPHSAGNISVPIQVIRLDENGGQVALESKAVYQKVESWKRTISFGKERKVSVGDRALLKEPTAPGVEWFRFITAEKNPLKLEALGDKSWRVTWPKASLLFTATEAIHLETTGLPHPYRTGEAQAVCVKRVAGGKELGLETALTWEE